MVVRPSGLIVYMSDFGWRDPYHGIVKGVIDNISAGKVKVIDLTHDVPAFSITAGAYVLYTSYRYFRPGTVFLVVVDPGVGTERRAIVIVGKNYYFVGPDNGVLYPAAAEDGIEAVYNISNEAVFLKPVSKSFHARDIFAPAATLIALGVNPSSVGERVDPNSLMRLELRKPCRGSRVEAEVVYIDRFGNVALGLETDCVRKLCDTKGLVRVEVGGKNIDARCLPVFSHGRRGELVFYVNSLGFPELAVNLGSASELLRVDIGDKIALSSI